MNVCIALGSFQEALKHSQGGFTGSVISQHLLVQLFLKNVGVWESMDVITCKDLQSIKWQELGELI